MTDCVFCDIGTPGTELSELAYNRHILDSDSFYVVAGRGQICPGYAIICSRKHLYSMSSHSDEDLRELNELKNVFRSASVKLYGCQPVFFEHGDSDTCHRGGSCISHAHLHIVPMQLNEVPQMLLDHSVIYFSEGVSAREYMREHSPYFYLELSNGDIYVLNSDSLPCQFGRQLLCKELNLLTQWDWRPHLDSKEMFKTIEDYGRILKATQWINR